MNQVQPVSGVDSRVIDLVYELGANPSQMTMVNHYLYFPKRRSAERAGEALIEREFDTAIRRSIPGRHEWCLFASHLAVVTDEHRSASRVYGATCC